MGGRYGFALARHALDRVACFVIGGAPAGNELAHPTEPGNEDPMMTALRGGPDEFIKLWGEWVTPPLRERTLANDYAALIACVQGRRLNTKGHSDVIGKIAVPTLIYAGSADPIHDPARQSASEIPGAQFVSLPGLNHVARIFPHRSRFPPRRTVSGESDRALVSDDGIFGRRAMALPTPLRQSCAARSPRWP